VRRLVLAFLGTAFIGTGGCQAAPASTPSPSPVGVGGRVELTDYGMALTFPSDWVWARHTPLDLDALWDQVETRVSPEFAAEREETFRGLGPTTPVVAAPGPDDWCQLTTYPSDLTLDAMVANDVAILEAAPDIGSRGVTVTDIALEAGDAKRIDWSLADEVGTILEASDYELAHDGSLVLLSCATFLERRDDTWLAIAQSLEFLPQGLELLPQG